MKNILLLIGVISMGFMPLKSRAESMIYPYSWWESTQTNQLIVVEYYSCDSLWDISTFYIDYFSSNNWSRIGDLSWLSESNEGYEWGGIYYSSNGVIEISCYGPWQIGVLSTNGRVPQDERKYVTHIINIQFIVGSPERLLGNGYKDHLLSGEELSLHLSAKAREVPDGAVLYRAGVQHYDNDMMQKRIRLYEQERQNKD